MSASLFSVDGDHEANSNIRSRTPEIMEPCRLSESMVTQTSVEPPLVKKPSSSSSDTDSVNVIPPSIEQSTSHLMVLGGRRKVKESSVTAPLEKPG